MTAVSKNMYINKLPKAVNNNNTIHRTIYMKLTDVKIDRYIGFHVESNIKTLNLRMEIKLSYQDIEIRFEEVALEIEQKKYD